MTENNHLYAGAYALNALPLDERAFFERHLASCEMCQQEVAGYAETAAKLGSAVAVTPPAHLRELVLQAADTARQMRPTGAADSVWSRRIRPALAPVAAGLAAAVLGLGGVTAYLYDQNQDIRSELAEVSSDAEMVELLASANAVTLDSPEGVSAGFLHSQDEDRGLLVVHGLPELDDHLSYQLWLFHDGVPVPAGVFSGSSVGTVKVPAEAPVIGAELVAVTIEPAGGLAAPTGSVVLGAQL